MFPLPPKKKKIVYLDHAAATPLEPTVLSVMNKYIKNNFANPSALYSLGVEAKEALDKARNIVAEVLSTHDNTVIFTAGGTESVNLAILGAARKHIQHGKHIVTTKVEHHTVLNAMEQLKSEGFEVTYLDTDASGQVNLDKFKQSLRSDTILVSVMYANNEVGTVLPIADIGREILRFRKQQGGIYPLFHTDACQAGGYLDLNVEKLHVDLLSLNGSKIYGPKGSGVLFKRRGAVLQPLMRGGGQEMSLRPGTENVAGAIGFAHALRLVQNKKEKTNKKLSALTKYFWQKIKNNIKDAILVGPELGISDRLPNNLNVIFPGTDVESLILYLDRYGIICSSGAACSTESKGPSHVLQACLPGSGNTESVRFTLGKNTTKVDIDYALKYLIPIVKELRRVRNLEK